MDVVIEIPEGVSRSHRLIHFQGIASTRESYHMEVYVDWGTGEEPKRVGSVYSYGFGDAMDEEGLIPMGLSEGQTRLEIAPVFDSYLELPEDIAERLSQSHSAKLIGVFSEQQIKGDTSGLFKFKTVTVEAL